MQYLAHTKDMRQQTMKEHACNVARLSEMFADEFDSGKYAYYVGMYHDIGKYTSLFQRRVRGEAIRAEHSLAGAVEFYEANANPKHIQYPGALCIAGHHSGIPNFTDKGADELIGSSLTARLKRKNKSVMPDPVWQNELDTGKQDIADLPWPSFEGSETKKLSKAFWCHFLYSCLTDADFLDTAAFMGETALNTCPNVGNFENLIAKANSHIEEKGWLKDSDNELNQKRSEILRNCINCGDSSKPGLFSLTVPTGGGKTFASLMFALHHARANSKKRIVYVIPYTSIIEQNAQVFREILGDDSILEHHSNHSYELKPNASEEECARTLKLAKATENWDAPIIVTTAVQFFESLFSNKPGKSRKIHNLANSVIVFDEAQMLPMPFLYPCVFAIAELVQNYGATAVLCTATQPALWKILCRYLTNPRITEICPKELSESRTFQRVTFEWQRGRLEWASLAWQVAENRQALCILNSRKKAYRLFEEISQLRPKEEVFHLSTLMVPVHRQKILAKVKERIDPKQNLPCVVISTSLIEAGVDVDFPHVYREINGLDSILQAAGRCNREGRNSASESLVTVFELLDNNGSFLFRLPVAVCKRTIEQYSLKDPSLSGIASPEVIKSYFHNLFTWKGDDLDARHILDLLGDKKHADVAREFQIIDSQRSVFIPYDKEGAKLCEAWLGGDRTRETLRKISRYSISLYGREYLRLRDLDLLDEGRENEDAEAEGWCGVLKDMSFYSEASGLLLGQEIEEMDSSNPPAAIS